MLKLEADCPYCLKPMKGTLLNLSPDGRHYLRYPYNLPEPWSFEGYDFTCGNEHAYVMISVHEYYYHQYSSLEESNKAHEKYTGPLTPHGYKPIGYNRDFDGTVKLVRLLMSYDIDKNYHAYFMASPGETPFICVSHWGNPYLDEFHIDCNYEWLSWSPDKIVQMMKLTLQEHSTEFNKHYEGCEEWDVE